MDNLRPRAIFIGQKEVGDALERMRKDWDFLPSVETIEELWVGLNAGTISTNIQSILVIDKLFDPTGEDRSFEQLIVTMSPHCFLGIINYTSNIKSAVRERVDYEAYSSGGATSDPLYFWIDTERPNPSLDAALNEFAQKSEATEVVSILTGVERVAPIETIEEAPEGSSLGEVAEDSEYLGQIVAVTSSKGGSGKSTISTTLATYLAHAGLSAHKKGLNERPLRVIVLDLDVRDGQLGFLTGKAKPTVINMRLKGISQESLMETVIYDESLKVDLLLAPKRPRNSDDTPPEFYIELLQLLRMNYDYIILDTSVNYLDPLLEKVAYPTADQIVFVTDIVVNSVFSMTRWIQEVTKTKEQGGMGINPKKVGIVVNKALADVNMSADKIKRSALGLPIITIVPSNPKLVAHAANMQSIEILLQHPEIRGSITRLAKAIVGKKWRLFDKF